MNALEQQILEGVVLAAEDYGGSVCSEWCFHEMDDPADCPTNDKRIAAARELIGKCLFVYSGDNPCHELPGEHTARMHRYERMEVHVAD